MSRYIQSSPAARGSSFEGTKPQQRGNTCSGKWALGRGRYGFKSRLWPFLASVKPSDDRSPRWHSAAASGRTRSQSAMPEFQSHRVLGRFVMQSERIYTQDVPYRGHYCPRPQFRGSPPPGSPCSVLHTPQCVSPAHLHHLGLRLPPPPLHLLVGHGKYSVVLIADSPMPRMVLGPKQILGVCSWNE